MRRVLAAALRPAETSLLLVGRRRPLWLWRRLGRLGRMLGFERLYLLLSFDCDTPEDADVVLDVDARVRRLGTRPAYAVPGALLEAYPAVYGELRHRGAEFLNHGYEPHARWSEARHRYESCFFYDRLPRERVRRDIERGHVAVQKTLDVRPTGFRAPHFGTFQAPSQLRFLHAVLRALGYRFSSSTVPAHAFRRGPVWRRSSLVEFPVTGVFTRPLLVHDSWGFYAAPDREAEPDDYLAEAAALARFCRAEGFVGVLNYYADPSHVWNQPTFFDAVALWAATARAAGFEELCRP